MVITYLASHFYWNGLTQQIEESIVERLMVCLLKFIVMRQAINILSNFIVRFLFSSAPFFDQVSTTTHVESNVQRRNGYCSGRQECWKEETDTHARARWTRIDSNKKTVSKSNTFLRGYYTTIINISCPFTDFSFLFFPSLGCIWCLLLYFYVLNIFDLKRIRIGWCSPAPVYHRPIHVYKYCILGDCDSEHK